jgi:CheY-like chemotaxis protein
MITSICIIDDDTLYKLLLKKSIKKLPFEVTVISFNNGQEAFLGLQQINAQKGQLPDIILLDINMPVMDGWEFLEAYKSIKAELLKPIKIYMASSSIAINDLETARLNSEVLDYLVKPISHSKIQELFTHEPHLQLQSD